MIEVLATYTLNTIQDLGRFGYRNIGVSTTGAMDALALRVGNCLAGNDENAAAIEIQTFPFKIRFLNDHIFAVTGGDVSAMLDGQWLPPWWRAFARKGQELVVMPPKAFSRACLCVQGGIDVPVVLGSRSTHLRGGFGGLEGRYLKVGDILKIARPEKTADRMAFGIVPPHLCLDHPHKDMTGDAVPIRVLRAAEYGLFPADMQRKFWQTKWKITPNSDRGGYRLSGDMLKLPAPVELRSYGVVPGVVQIPPSGEPIIQMSDANTAGGYPKMAGVIEADIWRLAQARIGQSIQFIDTGYDEALAAMAEVETWLHDVTQQIALRHFSKTSPMKEKEMVR